MTDLELQPRRIADFPLRNLNARLLHFDTLDSTNTFLKDYAQTAVRKGEALVEGLCALADEQTAGRGRMGRCWHSPRVDGFYFSILLTPRLARAQVPLLTLMAAVATAEAIETVCPRPLDIKWPNDILIAQRKVAGILTEAGFEAQQLNYVVIGIGVNLNHRHFPDELHRTATSLYLEKNGEVDRELFLMHLINRLDQWYGVINTAAAAIIERWQQLSSFAYGKVIEVEERGQSVRARTCGLTPTGALLAQTADGELLTLYGGEVNEPQRHGE